MSASALLDSFNLVIDSRTSIPLLRKLIVGLAVKGRLVEETAREETAARALEEIAAAAAQSPEGRSVRWLQSFPPILPDEIPGGLSGSCRFERLARVAILKKGPTAIQKATPGKFPLVVTAEKRESCDHFDFVGPAAIIPMVSSAGHGKASLHRLHFEESSFALGNILCAAFPFLEARTSARFLYAYLTAFKEELLVSRMVGTANVSLTLGKIGEVPVPVVSSEVQRRVDELMELCDRLEVAQKQMDTAREVLLDVSALRLCGEEGGRDATTFFLSRLSTSGLRSGDVRVLRRSVLDLAARGRVCEQDPADESVEVLLARCRSAMDSSRRPSPQVPVAPAERDGYVVPPGWGLARLEDIALKITDGAHKTPTYVDHGVPFVSVKDFSAGRLDLACARRIPEDEHASLYRRCDPRRGDILLGRIGTLGKAVVVDTDVEFSLFVSVGLIRVPQQQIVPEFLRIVLNSPVAMAKFDRIKVGGGTHTNKLNLEDLRGVVLPIAPTAEQRRIVAYVDALMGICDRLEAALEEGRSLRERLLGAALREALAGEV